jgi:peptidoglycan/xylan/chitin deacetylase (PgdA/CDA1 family)
MTTLDPSLPCRVTCSLLRLAARVLPPRGLSVITSVPTREAMTALTVDDGPHPATTPILLDVLRRHDARATFFLIGERATAHPDLVTAIVAEGHEVANHLWRDEPSVRLSPDVFRQQLSALSVLLRPHGEVVFFRPGSGFFTARMLRDAARLQLRCVLGSPWLVATTYRGDPEAEGRRLGRRTHPGAVVVLHEGVPERVPVAAVADALLRTLRERGLRAVSMSELVAARNRP